MPWPRLKMMRLARHRLQNVIHRPVQRRAAGDQGDGIQIALHRAAQILRRPVHRRRRVQRHRIHARRRDIGLIAGLGGGAGKTDDPARPGFASRTAATILAVGSITTCSNSAAGNPPAQLSKICTASAPASSWRIRWKATHSPKISKRSRSPVDRDRPTAWPPSVRRRLRPPPDRSPRSRARRQSPAAWSPGGQARPGQPQRLVDRLKIAAPSFRDLRRSPAVGCHRRQAGAFALGEGHLLAQRLGHRQDVGEQDGGVKAETADRLQGHFRGIARASAPCSRKIPPWPAARDTPADSARPGASARQAASFQPSLPAHAQVSGHYFKTRLLRILR